MSGLAQKPLRLVVAVSYRALQTVSKPTAEQHLQRFEKQYVYSR